jgi:CRP/FNR family transcriptional regulator, cyclic AMP receptor protein
MRNVGSEDENDLPWDLEDLLSTYNWFTALPEEKRKWVLKGIRERHLLAGEALAREGHIASHTYIVLGGLLTWSVTGPDGNQITMHACLKGSWFGAGTLLMKNPQRGDIVALRRSKVACMSSEVFHWLLVESIAFNNALVRHAFMRLQWFMGSFAARNILTLTEQVGRALLGLVDDQQNPGAKNIVSISQDELALLAGVSRQRCNSAMRKLSDAGIISTKYCSVSIINKDRLIELVSGSAAKDASCGRNQAPDQLPFGQISTHF